MSVVIATIRKGRMKMKSFDYQIVSLAIADLLVSIFIPVVMIHDLMTTFQSWKLFGNIGCMIFPSINALTMVSSAWMMVVIAISRFR